MRGWLGTFMVLALMLAGLGFVLYPVASSVLAQQEAEQALAAWRGADELRAGGHVGTAAGEGYRPKEGDATYEQLLAYNDAVRSGTGDAVNDPFAFDDDTLARLGLPDGIIGSVTIERLDETIPLYLGASSEHLTDGAGVVAGTALPTGGEGNACVIAAHRGPSGGLPMMRDVETMVPGDLVVVETPWDTLVYRMVRAEVITPNDVAALAPEPGRDTLTLLTCHPYGNNYQRYLVRCERVETGDAATASQGVSLAAAVAHAVWPGWSPQSPLLNVEAVLRLAALVMALACAVLLLARRIARLQIHGCRRRSF